jgi:2'-5' RNA ligase
MRKSLFFIAIIPPEPILGELLGFKHTAAEKFRSGKALNSPPHITLVPPFQWDERKLSDLLIPFFKASATSNSFYLTLDGFDHFGNKVIFVKVHEDKQMLALHRELISRLRLILPGMEAAKRFHPHATVAFRDLTPANFIPAWDYFSTIEYLRVFHAVDFHLLRHNGNSWKPVQRFELGKE